MRGLGNPTRELPAAGRRLIEDFPRLELVRQKDRDYFDGLVEAKEKAAEFTRLYVKPRALDIDRRVESDPWFFDWELVRAGLPYGLLSMTTPRELGGLGGLCVLSGLVVEELSAGCAGIATIFGAHLLGAAPLLIGGSLEHVDGCLYDIAAAEKRGEPLLMAFAITEPTAGTDVEEPLFLAKGRPQTQARQVPGGYLLNGTKCFISNGSVARYITVYMPLDRSNPLETWTCFLVDTERPGFSVSRLEHKAGQRACHAAEIFFDDYFLPDDCLVGEVGQAMQPGTLLVLAASRPPVGAIGAGIARGALERFTEWAQRSRRGIRTADQQAIQMAIMEMRSQVQAARQLYMDACMFFDFASCGRVLSNPVTRTFLKLPRRFRTCDPVTRILKSRLGKKLTFVLMRMVTSEEDLAVCLAHSSMAKVIASDVAMGVSSRCLELIGTDDTPLRPQLEKLFRDAKLTQIYEGTNQLNMLTAYRALYSRELRVELP